MDEGLRLDNEWLATVALREGLTIAQDQPPTYLETFAFGELLYSDLFDPETSLLRKNQESRSAREYREMAKAESTVEQKEITAIEIVERDIARINHLLSNKENKNLPSLKQKHRQLHRVKDELSSVIYVENQIIDRDVNKVQRNLPISGQGKDYKEFSLSDDRALRIRLLHPNRPEHITGADLIYELYSDFGDFAYITAVQYKLWDEKDVLYMDDRIESQIAKLKENFCDSGLCETPLYPKEASSRLASFCAAFLRMTNRLQSAESKLISTGEYIPVCKLGEFQKKTTADKFKLTSKDIREFKHGRTKPVPHGLFEEMVKGNMLGSRRVPVDELEEIYKKFRILDSSEKIIIHAQDYLTR
ncbi:hypothetical protein C7271_14975 [filamentous cyanobacterium CCP5]|nr:hypothetical protein C7271_14975 [filamentous cyanobacterium CCP5]